MPPTNCENRPHDRPQNTSLYAVRFFGLVQGVGFRPMIWKIANELKIHGDVCNDGLGVLAHFQTAYDLDKVLEQVYYNLPPLARIDAVQSKQIENAIPYTKFTIINSKTGFLQTGMIADAATCAACLNEILDVNNRRHGYSFTNCTHCGPRVSIIKSIPYDRANTSMSDFEMCDACQAEYENPADRRFHAQPNACPNCGPQIWMCDKDGQRLDLMSEIKVIQQATQDLMDGKILAIKGIGGFHLVCRADDDSVVVALRQRKKRPFKPLALMAVNIEMIGLYTQISSMAKTELQSHAAPIVLLPKLKDVPPNHLSEYVAPGQNQLGFMLPFTPLHHLLMRDIPVPLVMTSANISDQPQIIDNDKALVELSDIADAWLLHDRDIINRIDDSVVQTDQTRHHVIRRARGLSPYVMQLPEGFYTQADRAETLNSPNILACGGEMKNTVSLLTGNNIIVSQHFGDLKNPQSQSAYRQAVDLYCSAYNFTPDIIAVDLHPQYVSRHIGQEIAQAHQANIQEISHHHAHLCACLGEHKWPLKGGKVIGVILDGLGFGPLTHDKMDHDKSKLWGGEFLYGDYHGFERLDHLPYRPLIGAGRAHAEPWRNLLANLLSVRPWAYWQDKYGSLAIVKTLSKKPIPQIQTMLEKQLQCPFTTSAGRLFDAVAAALGICFERISYEGEAAIGLQNLAQIYLNETPIDKSYAGIAFRYEWHELWSGIFSDLNNNVSAPMISLKFHNTFSHHICQTATNLARDKNVSTIVLSGGVFQNELIRESCRQQLEVNALTVLTPSCLPSNDGGISAGQVLIAAARWVEKQGKSVR